MGTVPTGPLAALYSNTTPGIVADPAVVDAAIQIIVQTINDNWSVFQNFITATELNVANGSITSSKLRDGAVTQTKIIKEAVTQFTYDFAQIDEKIANVVIDNIPDSVIEQIATQVNAQLDTHKIDYTTHVPFGGVTTNSGNNYSINTPEITTLNRGMAVSIQINVDSTGASTLNWNGKGAKAIKKPNGLDATSLKANAIYTLRYNGANFILQGEGGEYGTATASDVIAGKTIGTETGVITGTIINRGALDVVVSSPEGNTIPSGYHSGVGKAKLVYTAGDDVVFSNNTSRTGTNTSYNDFNSKKALVSTSGNYRISFNLMRAGFDSNLYAFARLMINGLQVHTVNHNSNSYTTFQYDTNLVAGDVVQLQFRTSSVEYSWGNSLFSFSCNLIKPIITLG